jgi:signal peptidase I
MFRRALQWIALVGLTMACARARETDDQWIRGVYTGESPRAIKATESVAWQRASCLADHTTGAFVLVGSGRSMHPLYTPGTILVLRQLAFAKLKRGQTVLYRNKDNRVVAHVLVAPTRDGWRVRGLNNPMQDMEPVRPDNLVGVVMAAFRPTGGTTQGALATFSAPPTPKLN